LFVKRRLKTKTILIIEDEPWVFDVIKRFLSDQSYYILTATTLKSAAEIIKTIDINVILCDIKMNGDGGNGEDFTRWLRKTLNKCPRIVASTGGIVENKKLFDYIIYKPYTRDALIKAIEGKMSKEPWE